MMETARVEQERKVDVVVEEVVVASEVVKVVVAEDRKVVEKGGDVRIVRMVEEELVVDVELDKEEFREFEEKEERLMKEKLVREIAVLEEKVRQKGGGGRR